MRYNGNKVEDLKIAYIGGGSRGWAWSLMSDLALEKSLSGTVYLYDIDTHAAKNNEIIGNSIGKDNPDMDNFSYVATENIVINTTKRSNTWLIQTQQCFDRKILLKMHETYDSEDITDDCMLLELGGYKVKIIEGDYTNIKITTHEDINIIKEFI